MHGSERKGGRGRCKRKGNEPGKDRRHEKLKKKSNGRNGSRKGVVMAYEKEKVWRRKPGWGEERKKEEDVGNEQEIKVWNEK